MRAAVEPLSAAGLDEILDGARGRAGLERATCHQLRHTCFTRLREAGMALEAIQAQAGHASIESTRLYLHLANDWLEKEYLRAAEAIEAQARRPRRGGRAVSGSPARRPGVEDLVGAYRADLQAAGMFAGHPVTSVRPYVLHPRRCRGMGAACRWQPSAPCR